MYKIRTLIYKNYSEKNKARKGIASENRSMPKPHIFSAMQRISPNCSEYKLKIKRYIFSLKFIVTYICNYKLKASYGKESKINMISR